MVDNVAFELETVSGTFSNDPHCPHHNNVTPEGDVHGNSPRSCGTDDATSTAHDQNTNGARKTGEESCVETEGLDFDKSVTEYGSMGKNGIVLSVNSNNQRDVEEDGSNRADGTVTELDGNTTATPNTDTSTGDERSNFKMVSSSRKRKFILAMCTVAMFLTTCAFSLIGPFFPVVAETKGMSQALVGVVFAVFQLVIFLTAPLFANFLTKLGPKNVFIAGIWVGGVGSVLFGLAGYSPNGAPFIATTLACRCVQALGFSAFNTACFAIVSNEYPKNISLAFSILETGSGIGFILGSTLGGVLYQVGGYGLPFYVIGGLVLLNGLLLVKILPPHKETLIKRKDSMLTLLRSPMVVLPMLSVFVGVVGITTFEATLATHLMQFGLSTILVSLFFMFPAVVYTAFSVFWGYLSDKRDKQSFLIIGGHFASAIGYLLMGPSNLLPFLTSNLWTIGVGLLLIGMFFGCSLVPTMKCMVLGALELNFEDNIDTYALVSGLFNVALCLGGVVGPIGSAALIEAFGHRLGYTVIAMICLLMMLVSLAFYSGRNAVRQCRSGQAQQNEVV